jgi:hypothetical protein
LYWHEIVEAIADIAKEDTISVPGKLLRWDLYGWQFKTKPSRISSTW